MPVLRKSMHGDGDTLPPPWNRIFSLASRLFVWGLLFAVLYVLGSFFLLIFLTFVFSYIQANGVRRLQPYVGSRASAVVLIGSVLLTTLVLLSLYLIPKIIDQAENFAGQFNVYVGRIDSEIDHLAARQPMLKETLDKFKKSQEQSGISAEKVSLTAFALKKLAGIGEEGDGSKNFDRALDSIKNIGGMLISTASAFVLSLLFSFLIVLDLPKLTASVKELQNTRLRFVYIEVADSLYNFARVLGQAFEAQFLIAVLNTVLTALGLYALGLGKYTAFLSLIVFLFSFVPVAGVFISSVPICLIALQASGVQTMLTAIVLIIVIHLIEAYILNPRIYGYRLRINPVIVLIILTVGGKLFQFWGLILGVPICTYIFGYAIRCHSPNGNPKAEKPAPASSTESTENPRPEAATAQP
jgi:predicted PurR-regulated permease PerM